MSDEWGPWRKDNGMKPGQYVQVKVEWRTGGLGIIEGMIEALHEDGGIYITPHPDQYSKQWLEWRIRKPKGLTILTDILREVERDGDKVYGDRELEEVK